VPTARTDKDFVEFVARRYGQHPAQRAFLDDPARFRLALAGIGGGKTEAGCFDAVRHCLRFPGIKGLVAAPTYRMLKRSTYLVFKEVCRWWPREIIAEENKADAWVEFTNGSRVYFAHAQDPDTLRAVEVGFFYLDEAALCPHDTFRVLQGRIRQPGYPHRGWLTTTPKGKNWVYRAFEPEAAGDGGGQWTAERHARYSLHHWTSHDNPLYRQDPEFLRSLEESYGIGTDFYRQELLALWVAAAGLVYAQFDRDKCCLTDREIPPLRDFMVIEAGLDWGTTAPGCIIVAGVHKTGTVWVLDEVYQRGTVVAGNPGNDWVSVARGLREQWNVRMFRADPEDANAILSFQQAGLPVTKADNARVPGVRQVQALIAAHRFRVVEGNCPNFLAEIAQYHWRADKDGKPLEDADPAKEFDHAMDALRYVAMGLAGTGTMTGGPGASLVTRRETPRKY